MVKNVTLKDLSISAAYQNMGGIAGYLMSGATVSGCMVQGSISGAVYEGSEGSAYNGSFMGGIAGKISNNVCIKECTSNVIMTSADYSGGIVGYAEASTGGYQVTDCANTGSVFGANAVGGIVGDHNSKYALGDVQTAPTVSGCINTGSIPADAGAIVGNNNTSSNQAGKVENNYWAKSIGEKVIGTGAGSEDDVAVDSVNNNFAWDENGNFSDDAMSSDGQPIKSICDIVGHALTKTKARLLRVLKRALRRIGPVTIAASSSPMIKAQTRFLAKKP